MSYPQNIGTFCLTKSHASSVCADPGQWPWSRLPLGGVECDIISDSSVDGGGVRLSGVLDGHRQALVVSGDVSALLGAEHPAITSSRRATETAIAEQADRGRREMRMARDARRIGL